MNITVIGSEGQIGKPLVKLLIDKKYIVECIDKKNKPQERLDTEVGKNILEHKLTNSEKAVFLAFEVGGSKFLTDNDHNLNYILENSRLMSNTFEILSKKEVPFLFASSQMSNMKHTNYGFLKDLGERYCRAIPKSSVCRFWNVYGYEDPLDPKSHVITDFIHMAKTDGVIKMRTTGEERRQFLHTDDCSAALLHWIKNGWNSLAPMDITSFNWVSILEVAEIVSSLTGARIVRGNKADSIQLGIENEPNREILDYWKPEISLEEGIKKLL